MKVTNDQKQRYARQTILPEIGVEGQEKLIAGRVLCVGAGGLGCPVLQYLVAAGVGFIGIVDHDRVDISNLQRQVLFSEDQIGVNKAIAARDRLQALNSDVEIVAYSHALTADNCETLFAQYDVIVDASDNFATKFLINDAAYKMGKPWVYGSALGFAGQMAVFAPEADQPCYRCLFPEAPKTPVRTCAQAGVLGALVGMLGSMQALEAMKILLKEAKLPPVVGKLVEIDAVHHGKRLTRIGKDRKCSVCSHERQITRITGGLDMGILTGRQDDMVSPQQALDLLQANADAQLIDVREFDEWEAGHIDGADHCPLSLLLQGMRPENLKKDAPVILYCKAGVRSLQALQILRSQGYSDLKNMLGGYDLWVAQDVEKQHVA